MNIAGHKGRSSAGNHNTMELLSGAAGIVTSLYLQVKTDPADPAESPTPPVTTDPANCNMGGV